MRRHHLRPVRRLAVVLVALALGAIVAAGVAVVVPAGPSGAQQEPYPLTTSTINYPTTTTTTNGPGTSVLSATAERNLPVTGGDVVGMAVIGGVVFVAGAALLAVRRSVIDRRITTSHRL